MRTRKVYLISFVVTLASCNSEQPLPPIQSVPLTYCQDCHGEFTVLLDDSFTNEKLIILTDAASEWSIRTNNSLSLLVDIVPRDTLNKYEGRHSYITVFNREPGPGDSGWTEWESDWASMYIKPNQEDDIFFTVARHEFGHAFHLVHYYGPNKSIMNDNSATPDEDIACQDILDFCLEWNCDVACVPSKVW